LAFVGLAVTTNAYANQVNMHASACAASGNGMMNAYVQSSFVSAISGTESLTCPVPFTYSSATSVVIYVDGKNLVTQTTAPNCVATVLHYNDQVVGQVTRTAPLTAGSWELGFTLTGSTLPSVWDYITLECTVSSSIYGGLLGYTIVN